MCCCAPFVGHIPPMSLQNPKFPSKLNRTEMADEAELFCTSASKTVVFARLLVSVNDLHRGLSSSVFRVEQITQNPVLATGCGFDPRFRHHKARPYPLWMRSCFLPLAGRGANPFRLPASGAIKRDRILFGCGLDFCLLLGGGANPFRLPASGSESPP